MNRKAEKNEGRHPPPKMSASLARVHSNFAVQHEGIAPAGHHASYVGYRGRMKRITLVILHDLNRKSTV